jgi:hypothetical protein
MRPKAHPLGFSRKQVVRIDPALVELSRVLFLSATMEGCASKRTASANVARIDIQQQSAPMQLNQVSQNGPPLGSASAGPLRLASCPGK